MALHFNDQERSMTIDSSITYDQTEGCKELVVNPCKYFYGVIVLVPFALSVRRVKVTYSGDDFDSMGVWGLF